MPYLETRIFNDGDMTFWEFLNINDLKERYNEKILNYIKKSIVSQIDLETFKTGVAKNWISYSIKDILESIENNAYRRNIEIIRKVGQIYTFSHSTFSLKFRLYQDNYSKLIHANPKYKSYYKADKKKLIISSTIIKKF